MSFKKLNLTICFIFLIFSVNANANDKECFEKVSRGIFKFNQGFDNIILEPVAKAYNKLPEPIRKGTAHIIKEHKPIVIPIVIDGFRRSFDKKGLRIKKKGILQSFIIKEPLKIDYENDSIDDIVTQLEYAIEQHESFSKVIPLNTLKEMEELNKMREWEY